MAPVARRRPVLTTRFSRLRKPLSFPYWKRSDALGSHLPSLTDKVAPPMPDSLMMVNTARSLSRRAVIESAGFLSLNRYIGSWAVTVAPIPPTANTRRRALGDIGVLLLRSRQLFVLDPVRLIRLGAESLLALGF